MAMVACPYCYHRIDQARLAYQCQGRGTPGVATRCARKQDDLRRRMAGVDTPMLPVFELPRSLRGTPRKAPCPHCRGETGIRACPACHTPLSATFADSRSPLIGMIGGKGAGKTVFTAVLHHQLRGEIRRRFQADVQMVGDHQGGAGSARDWLEDNEQKLFADGSLFETTAQASDGMRAPVVLEWRQPRRRLGREVYDTTTLSFYDAAGEDLTSQSGVNDQTYLGASNGLILLLDPWQLPGARARINVSETVRKEAAPPMQVLKYISDSLRSTHAVKGGRKIPIPIAVVFAKMDAFFDVLGDHHPLRTAPSAGPFYDETLGQATHEQVRALLYEYGADDIDAALESNYSTFRYFAVSALGAAPDYAAGTVDAAGVRPFRVDEPLLWLLNRFGVIERSGR